MNVTRRCRYGLMTYNLKDQWQGQSYELYGESMESEINLLREAIRPGATVLDIGACFGSHTIPISHFVGPTGKVFAYEPERRNFCCLCGNVASNNLNNVFCYHQAIGGGSTVVRVPELNPDTTTNYGGVNLYGDYSQSLTYPLAMVAIDHLNLIACDLIKIDVEGMEIDVIEGAKGTINDFRPIIYVENDGRDPEKLQKALLDMEYEVYLQNAPLYNPQNYYSEPKDIFVNEQGAVFVSPMLFCVPKEKTALINLGAWSFSNIRYNNSNCTLAHGGSGTTTLSKPVRERNGDYEKYLKGSGIDIGGGFDTLETSFGTVRPWDVNDGDAQYMTGVPDNTYDFVYSAHCLEHLVDVPTALANWCRILKPGGHLFVAVPDWELYEQKHWPSRYNGDHKQTFSPRISRHSVGRDNHFNANEEIKWILNENDVDLVEVRIEDHNYNYRIYDVDQTGSGFNALAQICLIGRKAEVAADAGNDAAPVME